MQVHFLDTTGARITAEAQAGDRLLDIAQNAGLNWEAIGQTLKREGRLHLETY